MSDERIFKNVILNTFYGNDDTESEHSNLIIHAVTGEKYGIIKDVSGSMVGYCEGLSLFPKKCPGRPEQDGKRVAAYLAYWLGVDSQMNVTMAKEFAIRATSRDNTPSLPASLDRSLRRILDSTETKHLVTGLERISITDPDNAENSKCLLLENGFTTDTKDGRLIIQGVGWAWNFGDSKARYGKVMYVSPERMHGVWITPPG